MSRLVSTTDIIQQYKIHRTTIIEHIKSGDIDAEWNDTLRRYDIDMDSFDAWYHTKYRHRHGGGSSWTNKEKEMLEHPNKIAQQMTRRTSAAIRTQRVRIKK